MPGMGHGITGNKLVYTETKLLDTFIRLYVKYPWDGCFLPILRWSGIPSPKQWYKTFLLISDPELCGSWPTRLAPPGWWCKEASHLGGQLPMPSWSICWAQVGSTTIPNWRERERLFNDEFCDQVCFEPYPNAAFVSHCSVQTWCTN